MEMRLWHFLKMDYTDGYRDNSLKLVTYVDVTFCILYFSSNSCSTCFGQPCAHHQELTTA